MLIHFKGHTLSTLAGGRHIKGGPLSVPPQQQEK